MVSVEFGGLTELTRAVDNYRDNINTLYGNSDQFSLGPERVLRNIVRGDVRPLYWLISHPVAPVSVTGPSSCTACWSSPCWLGDTGVENDRSTNIWTTLSIPLTHGWVSIRSSVARRRTNVAPRWKSLWRCHAAAGTSGRCLVRRAALHGTTLWPDGGGVAPHRVPTWALFPQNSWGCRRSFPPRERRAADQD